MNRKADERLQHQLEQKLLSHGMRPPCHVVVHVRDGVVTLSGNVQHEYQRRAAVHACRATSGVRMVIDNLPAGGFHNVWGTKTGWEVGKPKEKAHEEPAATPSEETAPVEEAMKTPDTAPTE